MFGRIINIFALLAFAVPLASLQGQSAHQYLLKGNEAYQKGNFEKAEGAYYPALRADSNNPKVLYNLGNAHYRQGKYDLAKQEFTKATETLPNADQKADAFHNLGNTNMQQQKFGDALKAYQQALRLRPGDKDTQRNLQIALSKLPPKSDNPKQPPPPSQPNQPEDGKGQKPPPDNPPTSSENPQEKEQNQENQPLNPLPMHQDQLLESVGRGDQKSKRKYQQKIMERQSSTKSKDW